MKKEIEHSWIRIKTRLEDRLRYNRSLRLLAVWLSALRGVLCFRTAGKLNHWAESHRMAMGLGSFSPTSKALSPWITNPDKSRIWRAERIGWSRYGITGIGGSLKKSIVLRYPERDTKGILFVWFEYDLLTLLSIDNLPLLLDRYQVVFMGSWSPPCYQALWSFPIEYRKELLLGLSHPDDEMRLISLGFQAGVLPLYMSSWLDPRDFSPLPKSERDIDIVMVASWAKFKRHWVLFEALRKLNRNDIQVVLIGQPESGRTVEDVRAEADAFGVSGQIRFVDRAPVDLVWHWLERAKISLILSKREGSCVVVAESLMADTPVAMLQEAEIGSRTFIHSQTGKFLGAEQSVARDLASFLESWEHFQPRSWAEENISLQKSQEFLQQTLSASREQNPSRILQFALRAVLDVLEEPEAAHNELLQFEIGHNLYLQLHQRAKITT